MLNHYKQFVTKHETIKNEFSVINNAIIGEIYGTEIRKLVQLS